MKTPPSNRARSSTRPTKRTPTPAPLGLRMLGRIVLPDDAIASAYDQMMAEALALARRLVPNEHPTIEYLDASALLHWHEPADRGEDLAAALDMTKVKACPGATAQTVLDEFAFNIAHTARSEGFWFGMATAYLLLKEDR